MSAKESDYVCREPISAVLCTRKWRDVLNLYHPTTLFLTTEHTDHTELC
jgi:hypothetical protein